MATASKGELRKIDILKLEDSSGNITRIISPNNLQVGLDDPDFLSSLTVKGPVVAQLGITGSITQVTDGVDFLQPGTNISITKNSDGSLTIGTTGFPTTSALSLGNGLEYDSGTTFDGTTARALSPKFVNKGGLATPSSAGLRIDFDNLNTKTIETEDFIIFGETDNAVSYFPKKCTIADLLALGTAATLTNAITLGNGIEDSAGAVSSYNNTAAITLAITAESSKGIGVTSSGVKIDPSTLSSVTVTTGDKVLIGDINDSDNIKYVTAQSIANLATVGTLTNALTVGDGLQLNSGTTFDGTSARTLTVQAADSTISAAAGGISVLKVPSILSHGQGVTTFSYDGSSTSQIQIDLSSAGGLNFNGSDEIRLDINNLSAGPIPAGSDEISVAFGPNDTRKIDISTLGSVITTGINSSTVWSDGRNKAYTTSSIAVSNTGGYATSYGLDNYFYISGSIGNITNSAKISVFGGDTVISGSATALMGLSGSLTRLHDGSSYIVAGDGITVASSSNGQITITGNVGDITGITAGTGLTGGGTSGDLTIAIDDSIVATLTGSQFSGNIGVTGSIGATSVITSPALTGSLTQLQDGTSYLVAGNNIQIATGSSGAVTITGTVTAEPAGANTQIQYNDAGSFGASSAFTFTGTEVELNASSPKYTLRRASQSEDSSLSFEGAAGAVGSTITHQSGSNDLVFKTFGNGGSSTEEILRLGGYFSTDKRQVIFLSGSGMHAGAMQPRDTADINFFVSGSIDSRGTSTKGTAVFGGDVLSSGSLLVKNGITGSLTKLQDGTSYLIAGNNITIVTGSSGAVTIAGATSTTVISGSTSITDVSSINFSNAGILQDLGSGAVALTGSIGPAEDGTYSDGLFPTFTTSTPVGTAVDRFNEVLKALSPAPAPDLDNINAAETGVYSKLSFGTSNVIGGYTSVAASAGYGSAVNVNGVYQVITASNNIRMATFAGSTTLTGTLNSDVSPSNYSNGNTNYTTSSFGDAAQGVLRLMVNGSNVKEVDLTVVSIGAGIPGGGTGNYVNSNGSGFLSLSQTGSAVFEDAKTLAFFQHRTGKYTVSTDDQRNGWNYIRVLHVLSGSTKETNYMEWVNDSDSNALAASSETIDNFDLGKGIYLSGIRYYISGTADYKVDVSNAYRNVYSGSVSFNTTNCSISDQAIPALNTGAGENNLSILKVTGSATITATTLLNQTIASSVSVDHPLKSNLSSGGSSTSGGILLYTASNDSTVLFESFKRENYRITSASYNNQASVTATAANWNSALHLSSSISQSDGLIFYNQKLYTPINSLLSGDFRNSTDGGSITYAPTANPNYSGLNSGTKTFYRYFQNTTGVTKRDISVDIDGSGTIVQQGTANNTSKLAIMFKFPDTGTYQSGWLDLSQTFTAGSYSDFDGCLVGSLDSSLDAVNIATFGTQSIDNNKYIVMKVEADASWTGYVDDVTVTFGAGTGTTPSEAPTLDDIDCDDSGTGTKLSFGSSQSISGYTNSNTTAGFSAVNVNGNYTQTSSGNNLRRAVFNGSTVINGTLNEDVSANGSSYVANAFNSGSFGSIKLEVNGSVIHTTNLTSFGSGNSLNGNSSGFLSLLAASPAKYSSNNVPDYTLIYRTGEFQVGVSDQRNGWNYARIIHSVEGVDTTTNYVEWINDSNSDALSTSRELYDNFGSDSTLFYQSGVKYFIACTSSFEYATSNVYKNVYSRSSTAVTSPIRTNVSVSQIALNGLGITNSTNSNYYSTLANLDTSVADCEQKDINITGSITFSQSTSLVGPYGTGHHTASISGRVSHPMKSEVTTSTFNKSGFLVFSASQTSTKYTTENFDDENYRLISSSLSNQASFNTNGWNPTISMNDAGQSGYYDGLLIYNGYLITPKTGAMGNGDFRSARDGGSLQAPDNNVNYSSLGHTERNYTRYFENNTTNDVPQINVMISGSANLVARSGANFGSLGANTNFYCSIKIPGKTGWLDLARASAGAGNTNDGDGSLSGDLTATVVPTGILNICTFNGQTQDGTTSGEESIGLRITTHKNWTGNLINLKVGY